MKEGNHVAWMLIVLLVVSTLGGGVYLYRSHEPGIEKRGFNHSVQCPCEQQNLGEVSKVEGSYEQDDSSNTLSDEPSRCASLVILLHDVSPVYMDYLENITDLISSYGFQNVTYLFVIPNHAGKYDLRKYPKFAEYLHSLESQGYKVCLHGYTHIGREFDCNASTAERKLNAALTVMESVNLTPCCFLPPRYALSRDALQVLLSHNLTVFTKGSIVYPNGTKEPIVNREYTWYLPGWKLPFELRRAKRDYLSTSGTFFLSIHPGAVNNKAGMEFLREFLGFVKERESSKGP